MLFQQLLIFSCFTDSAAEIALLEMDLLFICIEINLTHKVCFCACIYCMFVCAGGWYGWNLCSLDGVAATVHSQVPLTDSPGVGERKHCIPLLCVYVCVCVSVKDVRLMCVPSMSQS